MGEELEAKRIGLLHDLVPQATTIGFLVNPAFSWAKGQQGAVEEAGHALKLQVLILGANSDGEIERLSRPGWSSTLVRSRSRPLRSSIRAAQSCWPCNPSIGCRRHTRFANSPPKAELLVTAPMALMPIVKSRSMSAEFSRAKSPRNCR